MGRVNKTSHNSNDICTTRPNAKGYLSKSDFSDMLVKFNVHPGSTVGDGCDSDDPFEELITSKNVMFNRSRSYFGDTFDVLPTTPSTPLNIYEKENVMSSSKYVMLRPRPKINNKSVQLDPNNQPINISNSRTPLKSYVNVTSTPRVEHSDLDNVFSEPRPNLKSVITSRNLFISPCGTCDANIKLHLSCKDIGLDGKLEEIAAANTLANGSVDANNRMNPILESIPKTPISSFTCQNTSTPRTDKTTPHQISSLKKYSLMKAAVAAKQDFENILKAVELKKSSLKNNSTKADSPFEADRTPTLNCRPNTFGNISSKNSKQRSKPSKCCLSLLNTPSDPNTSISIPIQHSIKTPLSTKGKTNNAKCVGKSFDPRLRKNPGDLFKLPNKPNRPTRINFNNRNVEEDDDDDDLPCTQPISTTILRGIVAYVEVRSGKEYRCNGTIAELETLGAKIEKNFTKKVTHCFFHGGKMSTYRKAIEWKIPLVSTLWIEACKAELRMVPIEGFEPHGLNKYKEELPLYRLKTKIRRPVTDSKVLVKLRKAKDATNKSTGVTANKDLGSIKKTEELIGALHSVAGDFKKASHQFEKILTSPILQRRNKTSCNTSDHVFETNNEHATNNETHATFTKKRNKKLVFGSSSEEEGNKDKNKPSAGVSSMLSDTNDFAGEIRVSYDSDDLLVYAKKQAVSVRCSAPSRLLTSRKCKKLLSSCSKPQNPNENDKAINCNIASYSKLQIPKENDKAINCDIAKIDDKIDHPNSKGKSKTLLTEGRKFGPSKKTNDVGLDKPKPKKRKLCQVPFQVIKAFEQDSGESAVEDLSPLCPYTQTLSKRPKTAELQKNNTAVAAPPVWSDADSEDSLTRAARRESSALFVKKQKKANPLRNIPSIVCTSLHRSDVEVVSTIVAQLGKFVVEGTVSERTTHVITNGPRRTINLLKGIARGCWVLNIHWAYESLEVGKWLPEERFELVEFSPSVRQARVERQAFGPEFSLELFDGMGAIYVCRTTVPPASDLTELIRLCGGTIVSNARSAKVIVGSALPFSPNGHHPLMVKEKWVLDSITKLTKLSPYNYVAVDSEP